MMQNFWMDFGQFLANQRLKAKKNNLTIYTPTFKLGAPWKEHKVFKNCNLNLNKYFWFLVTNNGSYFYTTPFGNEGSKDTLYNIIGWTQLMRGKPEDDYFESILLSYLLEEDTTLLFKARKEEVVHNGITICTPKHFEDRRGDQAEEMMPSYQLTAGNKTIIIAIDTFNDDEEVKTKLNAIQNAFPFAQVYVLKSNVQGLEQLSLPQNKPPFFTMKTFNENELIDVQTVEVDGRVIIDIVELDHTYFPAYRDFWNEAFYWRSCSRSGEIVQS